MSDLITTTLQSPPKYTHLYELGDRKKNMAGKDAGEMLKKVLEEMADIFHERKNELYSLRATCQKSINNTSEAKSNNLMNPTTTKLDSAAVVLNVFAACLGGQTLPALTLSAIAQGFGKSSEYAGKVNQASYEGLNSSSTTQQNWLNTLTQKIQTDSSQSDKNENAITAETERSRRLAEKVIS